MKKTKTGIIIVLLIMLVGFAAVSTTLVMNGTAVFGTNTDDFDVIFTKSVIDGVDVSDTTISEDGKSLTFSTGDLAIKDDLSVLNFIVTNNSTQYDANITMECVAEGENASEYYTITNTIPEVIEAKSSVAGSITATLKKSSVESIVETFTCRIAATAIERTEVGVRKKSEITVTATDENNNDLNAKSYVIEDEEKDTLLNSLVETGYVTSADEIDAIIEVESDEFENIADTTFDVSTIANSGDTVVILHFNESTQEWEYVGTEVVDENGEINADFTSYSPVAFVVVKEDGTYEGITNPYAVGTEVTLAGEKFNIISSTEDTVTMLAAYNLGTDYKQTTKINTVTFSNLNNWEYIPGPKEINIQLYDGNVKTYVNKYVSYLQTETGSSSISGNLITLKELKELGCTINDDYSYTQGLTCVNSCYANWLVNGQYWWTRSACTSVSSVWFVWTSGGLSSDYYSNAIGYDYGGVRPVITISKDLLI